MISFLKQIAARVALEPDLEKKTLVFPNQRSSLVFSRHLSEHIQGPVCAPKMLSVGNFFLSHSTLFELDHLTLIYRLYEIYKVVMSTKEPFYRFYFWGDMLLHDFDEIDKGLVDTLQLFRDLRNLKEIDASFDFMTDEQKVFLKTFWSHANRNVTPHPKQFLKVWKSLSAIYTQFVASLHKDKTGYEGLIQRHVTDELTSVSQASHILFVGFNALTRVEEKLICHYVEQGSRMYWDIDAYYVADDKQEAGKFFRYYRKHPILSRTFTDIPSMIKGKSKAINLISTPQHISQPYLIGKQLNESDKTTSSLGGSTVVIMPDEKLLFPTLYALPSSLSAVNITMGYPVRYASLYKFLELAIALQQHRKKNYFHHQSVTDLLNHTYVRSFDEKNADQLCEQIVKQQQVYIPSDDLLKITVLGPCLFAIVEANDALSYWLDLIETLQQSFTSEQALDQQCANLLHRHLSHIQVLLCEEELLSDWHMAQQVFFQFFLSKKIPFSQKNLDSLQVMGLLETRNLDFENVHILSLNEGILPTPHRQQSYIPYRLRKAYGLLTYEDHDAMHAYLFYRLLQRSKKVWMYYTTQVETFGGGEMSRYAKQLLHESGLPIAHYVAQHTITFPVVDPIVVAKNHCMDKLVEKYRLTPPNSRPHMLTPSALNDYLDCRLRFYFKHVASLYENKKIEETDMRLFGLLLHESVCKFYDQVSKKNKGLVVKEDLQKNNVLMAQSVEAAFEQHYSTYLLHANSYKGRYRVIHAMIKEWVEKIIERDRSYAPFTILSLEERITLKATLPSHALLLGGIVDRIDSKGDTIRIVDYKTGGDKSDVQDIASLFNGDDKRNKAAFQTFFYAYLYYKTRSSNKEKIMPGIMNRKNLFTPGFTFGHSLTSRKSIVKDVRPHIDSFEQHLYNLLQELYNPDIPFDQTTHTSSCSFCSYKSVCSR